MCIRCFKNSELQKRSELDPFVSDVFDSESTLELNPEVVTLTPGTLCMAYVYVDWLLAGSGELYLLMMCSKSAGTCRV
jgi:hypothetical protein